VSPPARRRVLAGAAGAAVLLGGCIAVPVPVQSAKPAELRTRMRGTEKGAPPFLDGATTRREILLLMGEPDRAWGEDGEQYFLYRADDLHAVIVVMIFGPTTGAAGGTPVGSRLFLAMEFDRRGVLCRHRLNNAMFHDADAASDACYRFERSGEGDHGIGILTPVPARTEPGPVPRR
jgi:hypothetical protein